MSISEQKIEEARMLDAARKAGVPVPLGEVAGEEPDFRFATPSLGIELSELIRPAGSNHSILPVEEAAFHTDVVRLAEETYYRTPDAKPAKVGLFFKNASKRQDKRQLAKTVAEFVTSRIDQATPFVAFHEFDAPEEFDAITIMAERAPWFNSECGGVSFSEIQPQVADRISAKNKRVRPYRANLPEGAQVWLLLYTDVTVPRSMPIPHGVEDWRFPFDFDRVFWFASLERNFVEIGRA